VTNVGVGQSSKRNARQAGADAANAAIAKLGGRPVKAVIVFANPGYDQAQLLDSIRSVTGSDAVVSGCSSEGVIYRGGCNETACAVVVMAFASETMTFAALNVGDFGADPVAAGEALAAKVRALGPERAKAAFVFPDGMTGNCTAAVQAFQRAVPWPIVIAGGAAGDVFKTTAMHTLTTYQICGTELTKDSISALVVGGGVEVEVAVSHGCSPLGLPRQVTHATPDGWIHELDGQPAWTVMKEYLDGDPQDLMSTDIVHLCIGEPLDAAQREAYGSDYVIRTPMTVSRDKKSLFFPGGLQVGHEVQFTRRDAVHVAQNAKQSAAKLAARRTERPAAILQFDCAGRGYLLFGERAAEEGILPAQQSFGEEVPWIGFYTFGEIAPIGPQAFYHNYTVVYCALYEAPAEAVAA
jgi:hypothetical protein